VGDESVSGTMTSGAGKTIQICVDGVSQKQIVAVFADGSFRVKLDKDLMPGQKVFAQVTPAPAAAPPKYGLPSDTSTVGPEGSEFDFGRVRMYLSAGAILSQDQTQFSKASIYADFDVDDTWFMRKSDPVTHKTSKSYVVLPKQVNTSFEARLTALPVTSCAQNGTATGCGSDGSANSDALATFNTTPKAALIAVKVYFPYYYQWSSWSHDDHRYALSFAPIAKGGFQTLLESAQTNPSVGTGTGSSPVTTVNNQTFFHF